MNIVFHSIVPLTIFALASPALSADFTGQWSSADKVCKYACTKEDPDPDFEVRISITLVQRGQVVCGYRSQNSLSDHVSISPLRGELRGGILEVEEGKQDFGTTEEAGTSAASGYPFGVVDTSRFRLSRKGMSALTESGHPFMHFKHEPFVAEDKSNFLQENKAYLEACFSNNRRK